MLNPDGVIVGNYRTGLAGCDLVRASIHTARPVFRVEEGRCFAKLVLEW